MYLHTHAGSGDRGAPAREFSDFFTRHSHDTIAGTCSGIGVRSRDDRYFLSVAEAALGLRRTERMNAHAKAPDGDAHGYVLAQDRAAPAKYAREALRYGLGDSQNSSHESRCAGRHDYPRVIYITPTPAAGRDHMRLPFGKWKFDRGPGAQPRCFPGGAGCHTHFCANMAQTCWRKPLPLVA